MNYYNPSLCFLLLFCGFVHLVSELTTPVVFDCIIAHRALSSEADISPLRSQLMFALRYKFRIKTTSFQWIKEGAQGPESLCAPCAPQDGDSRREGASQGPWHL